MVLLMSSSKTAKAHILSNKGAVRLLVSPSYRHLIVTYSDESFQVLSCFSRKARNDELVPHDSL